MGRRILAGAGRPARSDKAHGPGNPFGTRATGPGIICGVIEEPTSALAGGPTACPFVAFEDDRDHRSSSSDYRHRCFAAPEPEPRAFPHQERYCLSADFARCPVFLDWARQEAATVKVASAATATSALLDEDDDYAAAVAADGDTGPAFLASGSRTAAADARTTSRRTSDTGLWSYDGESKRSSAPSAPTPPSSLGPPPVAMARRGPSHPGWENPPRVENFPRLRSREQRRANSPLLFVAIGVAAVMVALALFPIVTGGGKTAVASRSAVPSVSDSGLKSGEAPSGSGASAEPGGSYFQYTIRAGDQWWAIARYFNINVCELQMVNPQIKDPNHLEVGWVLNVPKPGQVKCVAASPT
jgi:nucleoid-associated protein YgaU